MGWFYVEIKVLSSRELFLISVLTIFKVKEQIAPRAAAWTNKHEKTNISIVVDRSVCAFLNFDYSDHFYSPVTDSSQKTISNFTGNCSTTFCAYKLKGKMA